MTDTTESIKPMTTEYTQPCIACGHNPAALNPVIENLERRILSLEVELSRANNAARLAALDRDEYRNRWRIETVNNLLDE